MTNAPLRDDRLNACGIVTQAWLQSLLYEVWDWYMEVSSGTPLQPEETLDGGGGGRGAVPNC